MEEFNQTNELLTGLEFGSAARQLLVAAGVELSNDIENDFMEAVQRELLTFGSVEEARLAFGSMAAISKASKELQDA